MTKASDNEFPSVLFVEQVSAPTTPGTGRRRAYFKSDGLYIVDDAGTETGPLGADAASFSGARVYPSAAQTLANNTHTALTFNTEDFDTDTYHDNATNNTRLTIPSDGHYLIGAAVQFAANGTGQRSIGLRVDGTTFITFVQMQAVSTASQITNIETQTLIELTASQYVEAVVRQASGGNLDTGVTANAVPLFWIQKVS